MKLPDQYIENHVEFSNLPMSGYKRDRYLLDNPNYAMYRYDNGMQRVDPAKVPDIEYDNITERWQEMFDQWEGMEDVKSSYYIPRSEDRTRERNIMLDTNDRFARAYYSREAYKNLFPKELNNDYVEWALLNRKSVDDKERGEYEDDWFLMEHPEFYKAIKQSREWEKRDFRKVPTREVYALYLEYKEQPDWNKKTFRYDNPELQEWGEIALGWSKLDTEKIAETIDSKYIQVSETMANLLSDEDKRSRGWIFRAGAWFRPNQATPEWQGIVSEVRTAGIVR
jgi:hypothetical protein